MSDQAAALRSTREGAWMGRMRVGAAPVEPLPEPRAASRENLYSRAYGRRTLVRSVARMASVASSKKLGTVCPG